nr:MAG TPA: hypothetical protein [Caudoviricetes sp.]
MISKAGIWRCNGSLMRSFRIPHGRQSDTRRSFLAVSHCTESICPSRGTSSDQCDHPDHDQGNHDPQQNAVAQPLQKLSVLLLAVQLFGISDLLGFGCCRRDGSPRLPLHGLHVVDLAHPEEYVLPCFLRQFGRFHSFMGFRKLHCSSAVLLQPVSMCLQSQSYHSIFIDRRLSGVVSIFCDSGIPGYHGLFSRLILSRSSRKAMYFSSRCDTGCADPGNSYRVHSYIHPISPQKRNSRYLRPVSNNENRKMKQFRLLTGSNSDQIRAAMHHLCGLCRGQVCLIHLPDAL